MGPFLAALAPAALQSGLGYLSHRSAQKQREKERKEAERKAALANLVGRMGGQATGRQAGAVPALGNPLLKAAQGLSADPLVRQKIEDLVRSFMSRLPSGQAGFGGPPGDAHLYRGK